ncbi:MAG: recombination protein O N-terminal domain-containing protein [bacterium]|nr:recombination protein O N-terminal domain-containing protein [bacterium]
MSEYVTEAVVLGRRENGSSYNRFADLYTKELGFVEARVVGGRRITSKLSPHLDFGNFSFVRLVHKNQFTVADALTEERFFSGGSDIEAFLHFSHLAFLFRELLPRLVPDARMFEMLLWSLRRGEVNCRMFLSLFGYGTHAECGHCGSSESHAFFVPNQHFLCESCSEGAPSRTIVVL